MSQIFSGGSLGLLDHSLSTLLGNGQRGTPEADRLGTRAYVNAATGNLVVQRQDEVLSAPGLDLAVLRTYDSLGVVDGDNNDNWKLGLYRQAAGLTGTANTAGSTIKRIDGDGAEALYTYDVTLAAYVSDAGSGARDKLTFNGSTNRWTWTDGDSQTTEIYDHLNSAILHT